MEVCLIIFFRIKSCKKMRAGRSTVLTAPVLYNSSCWHPRIYANGLVFRISVSGITESTFVSLLTVAILVANLMVIITINSNRYTKFIHPQVINISFNSYTVKFK